MRAIKGMLNYLIKSPSVPLTHPVGCAATPLDRGDQMPVIRAFAHGSDSGGKNPLLRGVTAKRAGCVYSLPGALTRNCSRAEHDPGYYTFRHAPEPRVEPRGTGSPRRRGAHHEGRDLPELSDNASLEDLLNYAALNNPGLEALYSRWLAALEKSPQVGARPLPMLSYSHVARNTEPPMPPEMNRLDLTQRLPWPGKLKLAAGIADTEAEVAGQRFEAARVELNYRVSSAWYDYYYLLRNEQITRASLELLETLEAVARNRYSTGDAAWSDLMRAQVDMGRLENELKSLRDYRSALAARLNAELGRPAGPPLPQPTEIPEETLKLDEERLAEMLPSRNPDLRMLDREIEASGKMVALARKERFPDLEFGLGWMIARDEGSAGMPGGNRDPLMLMVGMELPISFRRYRAAEKEAVAGRGAAELERKDRLNILRARLQGALFEYRDAGRKVELYRDALIPKAEQSLAASREAFSAGKNTFLELIDAQRTLLELALSLEESRVNRSRSLAEIRMIVGTDELPGSRE